jgi:hypothetical protein
LWAGQGTFSTSTATAHAQALGQDVDISIGLFTGTFFFFMQSTQFVGNLLGSLILNYTGNKSYLFWTYFSISGKPISTVEFRV